LRKGIFICFVAARTYSDGERLRVVLIDCKQLLPAFSRLLRNREQAEAVTPLQEHGHHHKRHPQQAQKHPPDTPRAAEGEQSLHAFKPCKYSLILERTVWDSELRKSCEENTKCTTAYGELPLFLNSVDRRPGSWWLIEAISKIFFASPVLCFYSFLTSVILILNEDVLSETGKKGGSCQPLLVPASPPSRFWL